MTTSVKEPELSFENGFSRAAAWGDMPVLTEFLTGDYPITQTLMDHALFAASRKNQAAALSSLIAFAKKQGLIWEKSKHGPHMIYAASELAADAIDVFIAEGADVNARAASDGGTPLISLFVEAGIKLCGDQTAEQIAELRQHADRAARSLIKAGADPAVVWGSFHPRSLIVDIKTDMRFNRDNPVNPAILEWMAEHPRKYFGVFGPRIHKPKALAPA